MARLNGRAHAGFQEYLARRIHLEWVMVAAALTLLTFAMSYFGDGTGLSRLDHTFYDLSLSVSTQRPADQDIVIIAVDDGSLERIGHWPWRRTVHAQLLNRLHEAKAVGLDIVFGDANPAFLSDDQELANAIGAQGRVILPLLLEPSGIVQRPLASMANAARGLGYINIHPDSDGAIRSITLRHALPSGAYVDHFILAMLRASGAAPQLVRPAASPRLIPYAGPPGHFTMYPYWAVLDGDVPASRFKDKYVLVGTWGTGLGDAFPTPLAHNGQAMSGVEILANALQSTLQNKWIRTPNRWQGALLATLPVLLVCLILRRLSPRRSFFIAASLLLLIFILDWLLMRYALLWIPPTASLIGVALVYPVWSWRSQEAALKQIDHQLSKLQREQAPFKEEALIRDTGRGDASLPGRIIKLHRAIDHTRHLRRFFTDSLDATPDPTIIFDTNGQLRFASIAAMDYAVRLDGPRAVDGQPAEDYLKNVITDTALRQNIAATLKAVASPGFDVQATGQTLWQQGLELRDSKGNDMLLKCVPIRTADGTCAGTILTLVDISPIRLAERRREETLRFVSHDMRSPQNSILALVELQANSRTALPEPELLARIRQYSHKTLALVDGFVQLARAESRRIVYRPLDLVGLLAQVCDEYWTLAHKRDSVIEYTHDAPCAYVEGDRDLLGRALGNLVDNAIKYSPGGSRIHCHLEARENDWTICLSDQGRGMSQAQLGLLFTPFQRLGEDTPDNPAGIGLGLAFVKTIVNRHHGTIGVRSEEGAGTAFTVRLPRAEAEPQTVNDVSDS